MLGKKQFEDIAGEIANHPLLTSAAEGSLPLETWRRYFSARLQAGGAFVDFLRDLTEQAEQQGEHDIAAAARKNLHEELGIVDDEVVPARAHATWRAWFRTGMHRVMERRHMPIDFTTPENFPEVEGYPAAFRALNEEGDVLQTAGAFAVFEIGLGREYERILAGMDIVFPDELTAQERTYLVSHAHHEQRHFEEVFDPLSRACKTPAHRDRILAGAQRAKRTKLAFLDGALRKA